MLGFDSTLAPKRYWLFYAGPEHYLSDQGIREFPAEMVWSCEPETRRGDLVLVYRKSMNQLTVSTLVNKFGMTDKTAKDVKKAGIGKDFPLVWEVTSNVQRQPDWHWPYGCDVKAVRRIQPPIRLEELKAEPQLRIWQGLRRNLQADGRPVCVPRTGRSALEIPKDAWNLIMGLVDARTQGGTASLKGHLEL